MKVTVRGAFRDTIAFILHIKKRKRLFRRAGTKPLTPGAMNILASRLHPRRQVLRLESLRQETPSTKTFRLVPADENGRVAFFRAGQYISVEERVDGTPVSRPFSISSTPREAAEGNYYEITIKSEGPEEAKPKGNAQEAGGFFAPWSLREWKPGREIICSEPMGSFSCEPLRDADHIVCLAGGSGITPFKSIITDALSRCEGPIGAQNIGAQDMEAQAIVGAPRFTLLYGVTAPSEIVFKEEFEELARRFPEHFSMTVVVSGPDAGGEHGERGEGQALRERGAFETGFITEELIRRSVSEAEDASFFVCGPPAMLRAMERELAPFGPGPRRLRKESCGLAAGELPNLGGGPRVKENAGGTAAADGAAAASYKITVRIDHGGGEASGAADKTSAQTTDRKASGAAAKTAVQTTAGEPMQEPIVIPARASESVLVALERAGLNPPALCRSGECGWCRSKLVSGKISVAEEQDGRRGADKKFGWFHPCSSYPESDLEIEIPRNPVSYRPCY